MGNIGTTATILLIMVLFLGGISFISTDISNNTNLDSDSIDLLDDLGAEYTSNYAAKDSFTTGNSDPLIENDSSTCLGVDAFFKQSCLDAAEVDEKKSTMDKVLGFPGLFLKMFGVDNTTLLIAWSTAIYGFIAFMIGLQVYKAIRTGEVD